MIANLCNFLNLRSSKSDSYISLAETFQDDLEYFRDKYFSSTDSYAHTISIGTYRYNFCDEYSDKLKYLDEDFREPKYFSKKEARVWSFNEIKLLEDISKLLKIEASPIRLDYDTDGYYLGTLNLDKKYAIFFCYNSYNFEISSQAYIRDNIEPILFHTSCKPLRSDLQKFLYTKNGLAFNICELISYKIGKGILGGDIKKLLQFRGTKQKEIFNIGDLKHNLANPAWADLTITIIDRDKINIRIGTYSKTFRCSDISFFYNARTKEPKACWWTLLDFEKENLPYDNNLRNRLSELRPFFKKFKINGDPFVVEQDVDFKGKKKVKQSYARSAFKVKLGLGDYKPYN